MSDEKVFLVKPPQDKYDWDLSDPIHILKRGWVEVKDFLPWFAWPFVILFVAFLILLLNLVGADE